MNKQEFIERMKSLKNLFGNKCEYVEIDAVIELASELDEPQEPVVPQFVADWYEDIVDEFYVVLERLALNYKNNTDMRICKWFFETENALTILINMHQFGYTVEKERKYTVKVKATLGQYLGRYYLNNEDLIPQFTRTQFTGKEKLPTFTRKELEQTGFGWVFDCLGVEVKEVKEVKK